MAFHIHAQDYKHKYFARKFHHRMHSKNEKMTAFVRASNTKQSWPACGILLNLQYELSSPHSTAQEISMYSSDMVFFAAQRIGFIAHTTI